MTKRGISDFKHIRDLGEGKIGSVGVYEFSQGSGLLFKTLCLSSDKWKHLQGKQIAIKKIHRNFPEAYAAEKRVLERLGKISESGLIRYYGAEEDRENYYLFMELGKYGDLLSVAGRLFEIPGPQRLMAWRKILWHTTEQLMVLHSKGIRHQDIKPTNIVLKSFSTWDCLITDYGSAYIVGEENPPTTLKTTFGYAAPEQIRKRFGKKKSDVWSLAVTILTVSIGRELFDENVPYEIIFTQILDGSLLKTFEKESPLFQIPAAKDLLLGMLETVPKIRFSAEKAHNHPFIQGLEFKTSLSTKSVKSTSTAALVTTSAGSAGPFTGKVTDPRGSTSAPSSSATSTASTSVGKTSRGCNALALSQSERPLNSKTIRDSQKQDKRRPFIGSHQKIVLSPSGVEMKKPIVISSSATVAATGSGGSALATKTISTSTSVSGSRLIATPKSRIKKAAITTSNSASTPPSSRTQLQKQSTDTHNSHGSTSKETGSKDRTTSNKTALLVIGDSGRRNKEDKNMRKLLLAIYN